MLVGYRSVTSPCPRSKIIVTETASNTETEMQLGTADKTADGRAGGHGTDTLGGGKGRDNGKDKRSSGLVVHSQTTSW